MWKKDGNFDSIFLHVQVNNESAIEFYKKFGFEIVETKNHYYKRIEPADAHVLEKNLKNVKNCDSSGVVVTNHNTSDASKQNGIDSASNSHHNQSKATAVGATNDSH
ncbi:hypothetical protein HA402_012445 [Bradysia odoriphaga]|nr:hypothetical protein HA402_012445 [Bradysia odoriphaga]